MRNSESLIYVLLGEVSLIIAKAFDKIELSDATQVFVYAILAGLGGLVPKLIWKKYESRNQKPSGK